MSSNSELTSFAARLRRSIRACANSSERAFAGWPTFDQFALDLFALQFELNAPYRRFCEARGARPDTVAHWADIPAIPTSAFKDCELSCLPVEVQTRVFHSSGTTGHQPSRHFHNAESLAVYEASLLTWFNARFQLPIAHCQLAILTPPPAQAPHSSLVHMFETIRREFSPDASPYVGKVAGDGGWTPELESALQLLRKAAATGQPLLMLGTAFSFVHLLDHLAERDSRFELPPGSCAMETGGYKGRSRVLPQAALHALISQRLGILDSHIVCEYGMSELSSQAYDLEIGGPATTSRGLVNSDVSCPLTPALSLRERESHRQRVGKVRGLGKFERRSECLLLPKGEGWGEGEQRARPASARENPQRRFHFPPWTRVQIISPETGRVVGNGETGLIRVFDLANVYSVMAIQTEDLGVCSSDGFALAGRAAMAEPRGCSLMAV
jgi:hypothetical protein